MSDDRCMCLPGPSPQGPVGTKRIVSPICPIHGCGDGTPGPAREATATEADYRHAAKLLREFAESVCGPDWATQARGARASAERLEARAILASGDSGGPREARKPKIPEGYPRYPKTAIDALEAEVLRLRAELARAPNEPSVEDELLLAMQRAYRAATHDPKHLSLEHQIAEVQKALVKFRERWLAAALRARADAERAVPSVPPSEPSEVASLIGWFRYIRRYSMSNLQGRVFSEREIDIILDALASLSVPAPPSEEPPQNFDYWPSRAARLEAALRACHEVLAELACSVRESDADRGIAARVRPRLEQMRDAEKVALAALDPEHEIGSESA